MKDMKDLGYRKQTSAASFLSPFESWARKELLIEERFDETTGVASRILPFRSHPAQKPDIKSYLEKSPESMCPFCPQSLEQITPRFETGIIREGRFRRGDACLFPNAFPYDQSSSVAVFSPRHFVPMEELSPELMRDGFAVCIDYFRRIAELHKDVRYCSINWNYMPPAGGGLIHPHLQTIAGAKPTGFMDRLISGARKYAEAHGGACLWEDLVEYEKKAGERFIADTGSIFWLAPFSPKGMAGEVDFIFKGISSIFDIGDAVLGELLAGLSKVFAFLAGKNYISFNMALYAAIRGGDNLWVQGKIVPRLELNALGTSDLNYFEKLHDEIICLVMPEQLCGELKALF